MNSRLPPPLYNCLPRPKNSTGWIFLTNRYAAYLLLLKWIFNNRGTKLNCPALNSFFFFNRHHLLLIPILTSVNAVTMQPIVRSSKAFKDSPEFMNLYMSYVCTLSFILVSNSYFLLLRIYRK